MTETTVDPMEDWARRPFARFVAGCADPRGGPAAGSGSAAAAAVGCGLVSMALRLTAGERANASTQAPYLAGRADEVDAIRAQLVDLVDEDQRAYDRWRALVREGAAEDKVQKARDEVLEIPFEILERAVFALRLAAISAEEVEGPWVSELRAGAALLAGAHRAGRVVFEANLDAFEVADGDVRRGELGVLAGATEQALGALGLG